MATDRVFDLSVTGAAVEGGTPVELTAPITVTVALSAADIALAGGQEDNLVIQHYKGMETGWTALSTDVDFAAATASALVDSLSVFALTVVTGEEKPEPTLEATPQPTVEVLPTALPAATPTPTPTPKPMPTTAPTPAPSPTPTRTPPRCRRQRPGQQQHYCLHRYQRPCPHEHRPRNRHRLARRCQGRS